MVRLESVVIALFGALLGLGLGVLLGVTLQRAIADEASVPVGSCSPSSSSPDLSASCDHDGVPLFTSISSWSVPGRRAHVQATFRAVLDGRIEVRTPLFELREQRVEGSAVQGTRA